MYFSQIFSISPLARNLMQRDPTEDAQLARCQIVSSIVEFKLLERCEVTESRLQEAVLRCSSA
jgi:hypothetical protein